MSIFEVKVVGDESSSVRTELVRLKDWDGHNISFSVGSDGLFAIQSEDGVVLSREDIIRYKNWDGSKWIAKLWPPASFYLSRDGTFTGFVDNKLQFVDWENRQLTATPWIPNVSVPLSSFGNLHATMGISVGGTGTDPTVTQDVQSVAIQLASDSPFDEITPATPRQDGVITQPATATSSHPPADSVAQQPEPSSVTSTHPNQSSGALSAPVATAVTAKSPAPKLEGWLHKRGDVGIVLDWTWKQRYFRENDDGKLYYYDDRNTTNPTSSKGKIDLTLVTKVEINPSMNLGFNIITPGRTYVLRATSKADLQYWTSTLPLKCPKISPSPVATTHAVQRAASQPGLVVSGMSSNSSANSSNSSTQASGAASDVRISPSQIAFGTNGQSGSSGASANNNDISALRSNIRNASFSRDKIAIIQSSSNSRTFTCSQVFELLKELPFSEDKHEACIALYPKITDPSNFSTVLDAFDFSSDKDRVKKALNLI